jgi:anti-sigma B factor antagonist
MKISTSQINAINVLELAGRFDIYTAPEVKDCLAQAAQKIPANIVIDLSQVDFIDSTALATLIQGSKLARTHHGNIRLSGLRPSVRMVLELTRLDKVFEIYLNKEEAINAFN